MKDVSPQDVLGRPFGCSAFVSSSPSSASANRPGSSARSCIRTELSEFALSAPLQFIQIMGFISAQLYAYGNTIGRLCSKEEALSVIP